jgi:hypothetical protein
MVDLVMNSFGKDLDAFLQMFVHFEGEEGMPGERGEGEKYIVSEVQSNS